MGSDHDEFIVFLVGDPVDLLLRKAGYDARLDLESLCLENRLLLREHLVERRGAVGEGGGGGLLQIEALQQQTMPGTELAQPGRAIDDRGRGRGQIRSEDESFKHDAPPRSMGMSRGVRDAEVDPSAALR